MFAQEDDAVVIILKKMNKITIDLQSKVGYLKLCIN